MPSEPYVTVTLRKDVVKKLSEVNPNKPTSALVTDAINDYIVSKSRRLGKPPSIDYKQISDGTPSTYSVNSPS